MVLKQGLQKRYGRYGHGLTKISYILLEMNYRVFKKQQILLFQMNCHTKLVCEIPRSFERSSPSNFRTQGSFIHINSEKIFERDLLSSDSIAKSATQNLAFSETEIPSHSDVAAEVDYSMHDLID